MQAGLTNEIFNKQSKKARRGTSSDESFGLGLRICKQISEEIGGHIWFDSVQENDTTFHFILPAA